MIDPIFGIHEQALRARSQRMELLASNIANAATPGYKARDLDFNDLMNMTESGLAMVESNKNHMSTADSSRAAEKFRIPVQTSMDGNTVELATEQTAFAENSLGYQASLSFLNGRISTIMRALKGE